VLPILQTGGADCHAIFECRGARGHLNVNRGFHAPPRPTLAPLPLSQDSEGEAIEPAETKIGIFSAGGGFTAAHNSSVATETPSSVARRRPTFMMAREPAVKDPHACGQSSASASTWIRPEQLHSSAEGRKHRSRRMGSHGTCRRRRRQVDAQVGNG
jgi:hypothetical protein